MTVARCSGRRSAQVAAQYRNGQLTMVVVDRGSESGRRELGVGCGVDRTARQQSRPGDAVSPVENHPEVSPRTTTGLAESAAIHSDLSTTRKCGAGGADLLTQLFTSGVRWQPQRPLLLNTHHLPGAVCDGLE